MNTQAKLQEAVTEASLQLMWSDLAKQAIAQCREVNASPEKVVGVMLFVATVHLARLKGRDHAAAHAREIANLISATETAETSPS